MRNELWPASPEEHLKETARYFAGDEIDIVEVFALERGDGSLGGFVEVNLRNYAEGSGAARVPYVEGWYVDEDLRSQGYGKHLMEAAEAWAKKLGFTELASDAELENAISIAIHQALGFEEVERIVCFIKKLD